MTRGEVLHDISIVWCILRCGRTVHGLHVLVQDIPAVAEFESLSNLVANLDDLAFYEALAMMRLALFDRSLFDMMVDS